MNAPDEHINSIIKKKTLYLTNYIMKKENISENQALIKVVNSRTYSQLIDKKTHLYSESYEYILEMFLAELQKNADTWFKL